MIHDFNFTHLTMIIVENQILKLSLFIHYHYQVRFSSFLSNFYERKFPSNPALVSIIPIIASTVN